MAKALARALASMVDRSFIGVVGRVIGITLLVSLAMFFAVRSLEHQLIEPLITAALPASSDHAQAIGWVGFLGDLALGLGTAWAVFLVLPLVMAAVAGFFTDAVADVIDRKDYPHLPAGQPLPLRASLMQSLRMLLLVLVVNLLALPLILLPGINLVIYLLINGYLLGREYFTFAAERHMSVSEAAELRRHHRLSVLVGGVMAAGLMLVPLINLLVPLFAASLMLHYHRGLTGSDRL